MKESESLWWVMSFCQYWSSQWLLWITTEDVGLKYLWQVCWIFGQGSWCQPEGYQSGRIAHIVLAEEDECLLDWVEDFQYYEQEYLKYKIFTLKMFISVNRIPSWIDRVKTCKRYHSEDQSQKSLMKDYWWVMEVTEILLCGQKISWCHFEKKKVLFWVMW